MIDQKQTNDKQTNKQTNKMSLIRRLRLKWQAVESIWHVFCITMHNNWFKNAAFFVKQ